MQLEVGDMIMWAGDHLGYSTDTGWVIRLETRLRNGHDPKEYVVVHWLSSNTSEEHWVDWLMTENCKIIKGGQDDR